jgi:hypothetical protein
MALTYIIDTPDYDKNVGGICALHYLAECLLNLGAVDVYLTTDKVNSRWKSKAISKETPFFLGNELLDRFYLSLNILKKYVFFNTFKRKINRFKNKLFAKLLWRHFDKDQTVVICPEILKGTPLQAKNVVRWVMNTPGVCGGDGVFRANEHIFLYHTWFNVNKTYDVKGVLTAIDLDHHLKTFVDEKLPTRKGGAYLIRKGRFKKHNQHPDDFVKADNLLSKMTDEEASKFFNSIEKFISYDDMTFITVQAALCGCQVVIIPGHGDRSKENLKKSNPIFGVAYGFDDEEWASSSINILRGDLQRQNHENLATVRNFYEYCENTFG